MSQPFGQPGNLGNLPNSSSFGIPTSWDFSKNNFPISLLCLGVGVVIFLIAFNFLKLGRRRR